MNIKTPNYKIGLAHQTYIIAEMSANHCGSLEKAIQIVHAAHKSGANCIKTQTYTADTMTIDEDNAYFRIGEGLWAGETLYGLYQKAYTPWAWQAKIKEEAEKLGMDFLSTPFDASSVDFLADLGVSMYKVASFEFTDIPLIKKIAGKHKPIILSTGMASEAEIKQTTETIRNLGNHEICLLKCSSAYPAIPADMNLKTLLDLREKFNVLVGLSDHSLGSVAAIVAVSLGAQVIEKHFCIDRTDPSPDASFSMEPKEFQDMVRDIRDAEKAMGQVSYDVSAKEEKSKVFRRSIFAVEKIGQGEILTSENIRIIRPGYGLAPCYYEQILGKRALKDISRGTPMSFEMVGTD